MLFFRNETNTNEGGNAVVRNDSVSSNRSTTSDSGQKTLVTPHESRTTSLLTDMVERTFDSQIVEMSGYLKKQGGVIKTWNERWFVLKGSALHYYKEQGGKYIVSQSFLLVTMFLFCLYLG